MLLRLACCLLLLALPFAAARGAPPNIVFILADDLGYGDLSCYGATKVRTPNIDRLANEGMRFTDAHSPHSVCTPTRYGLLTGRYAWRTWAKSRCVWSDDPLLIDTERMTLPKLLRSAGYATGCVGKWHLGFGAPGQSGWLGSLGPDYNAPLKPGPLETGFDYFYGIPHVGQFPHVYIENHRIVGLRPDAPLRIVRDERLAARSSFLERFNLTPRHTFTGGESALYRHEDLAVHLTEKAVEWLRANRQKRFFLYFAQRNVHSPLKPNARFAGKSEIGVYGDFILELDWSVGRILDTLDELGLADDTLVFFSSDNGGVQMGHRPADVVDYDGHKANGPLRGQKTEIYEGGHRVPLLARLPGTVKPGAVSDRLAALTDTIATISELIAKPLPLGAAEDSFSYLSALTGGTPRSALRDSIAHDGNRGKFAVRQGDWKLLLAQDGGGIGSDERRFDPAQPPAQLYNLADDLAERTNLYEQRPDIVARLTALLGKIRDSGRSRQWGE